MTRNLLGLLGIVLLILAVIGPALGHGNNPRDTRHGNNPSPPQPKTELQQCYNFIDATLDATYEPYWFALDYPPWCYAVPCEAGHHFFNFCIGHQFPVTCEDCDTCTFYAGWDCMDRKDECEWPSDFAMECLSCVRKAQAECKKVYCNNDDE